MDVYTAAAAYQKIIQYEYRFTVVKNRHSTPDDIYIGFDQKDFFHLCGLHKLKFRNRYFKQESADRIFIRILDGECSSIGIEADPKYPEIESRIQFVSAIKEFMDSNDVVFKTNHNNTISRSKIQSDYILSYRDSAAHHLFHIKQDKSSGIYHGISCFVRGASEKDVTLGNTKMTILQKIRFDCSDNTQDILYSRSKENT